MTSLLPSSSDKYMTGVKFIVSSDAPTTQGWLENLKYLSLIPRSKAQMSDKKLLEGVFQKSSEVVVKISKDHATRHEWEIFQVIRKAKLTSGFLYLTKGILEHP